MGGKILRTHTDELIEQGYLKGLELSIKQGVENCASHSRYFSDELDAQFF